MGFIKGTFLFLIFLVLVVLLPVTLTATWAREQIYDEDTFAESLSGLITDPDIQQSIASSIAAQVEAQAEGQDWNAFVNSIATDDETRAELLADEGEIGPFVEGIVLDALDRPVFDDIWNTLVRQIHAPITNLLKGEDTAIIKSSDGVVVIELEPVYDRVNAELTDRGIDLSQEFTPDPEQLTLTVFDGEELVKAQRYVDYLNQGVMASWIVLGVLALLMLLFTRRKSRALVTIGLAIVIGMTIEIGLLFFGEGFLASRVQDAADEPAARAFFSEIVKVLLQWALIGLIVGAVVIVLGMIVSTREDNRSRSVYGR